MWENLYCLVERWRTLRMHEWNFQENRDGAARNQQRPPEKSGNICSASAELYVNTTVADAASIVVGYKAKNKQRVEKLNFKFDLLS